MQIKEWEYYSHIPKDMISNEVYMLLSIFGAENKYLKLLEKRWFEKRDLEDFRQYMEEAFEQCEISNKTEVNRDSLSCLLRLMAICDTFSDYEYIYDVSSEIYLSNKSKHNELRLYDYAFKQLINSTSYALLKEIAEINIISKYKSLKNEVVQEADKIVQNENLKSVIPMTYSLNDLLSDLLDLLEDDSDNQREFEVADEVFLYNFAIYYSTKFYFTLLLREKIILEEERINKITIEEYKPLIEEDDMRKSETIMLNDDSKEIFYKTLKN
ncbi:hypothetical protein SHELI_v1c01800 [Spiroplasma helicoides]|uniref:Uncharacterized protein n=1 Tax=Spiroplasma helicoides TaxID=216938 RepID=A0A1B3SJM9_9MOLU|nr:hypothetical protein [Spiroplasma helicoides]AOG60135.1 hypothetical protein SHELI_v1c01800 [Spiroplasma helicoides]